MEKNDFTEKNDYLPVKILEIRFRKCGGYDGIGPLKVSGGNFKLINFTPQETAFGVYVDVVAQIANNLGVFKLPEKYWQQLVNDIQDDLDTLALLHIKTKEKKVQYDDVDFSKKEKILLNLEKQSAEKKDFKADIAKMGLEIPMGYVVYYNALKMGFDLENPREILRKKKWSNFEQDLVKCKPVTAEQMTKAITEKLDYELKRGL